MNRLLFAFTTACLLGSGLSAEATPVAPDQIVSVWPNSPPTWNAPDQREHDTTDADGREVAGRRVMRLGFVSTALDDEIMVDAESPPMFFAHAADDRVSCMSSVTMFGRLQQSGVASSLHVFASGGHGFGGRIADRPTDAWRELCATWMNRQGWMKP